MNWQTNKNPDRRQKRSRAAILSAFSDLLAQKKYEQITVQEIIDRADVGRSTFYAHFETKDELLYALCNELFDHVLARAGYLRRQPQEQSMQPADGSVRIGLFTHIMSHLRDKNGQLLRLLSLQQDGLFSRYFKERMREIVRERIKDGSVLLPDGIPAEYAADHIASSFVDTVIWWAADAPDLSPEQVSRYFAAVTGPLLGEDI